MSLPLGEPENKNSNSSAVPDDSMSSGLQAVFEDPNQAAERRKLISLLNGAPRQSRMREERNHRVAVVTRSNVATVLLPIVTTIFVVTFELEKCHNKIRKPATLTRETRETRLTGTGR